MDNLPADIRKHYDSVGATYTRKAGWTVVTTTTDGGPIIGHGRYRKVRGGYVYAQPTYDAWVAVLIRENGERVNLRAYLLNEIVREAEAA